MKKACFSLKELRPVKSDSYKFNSKERNRYITEIKEQIKKEITLNEIKEAESIELASKFFTIM